MRSVRDYLCSATCQIPDADDVNLLVLPTLREALPFIEKALCDGSRILVRCERGASRSASVVTRLCSPDAVMRASGGELTRVEALDRLKAQRPCVQPNSGFLRQLSAPGMLTTPVLAASPPLAVTGVTVSVRRGHVWLVL